MGGAKQTPMRHFLLALAGALLALPAHPAGIERFQTYLRSTQSGSAQFEQKVYDGSKKLVQESKGHFSFQRPGRFRWVYTAPTPQLVVGDGERVWVYDEDLNQVTVRKMARAIGSSPAALLAGGAAVEQAFTLAEAGSRGGLEWIEAIPREREAGFERVRLGLGVAGVEAMELLDHFGQTSVLRFSNQVRNPPLDPGAFRFKPPKGADVLGGD